MEACIDKKTKNHDLEDKTKLSLKELNEKGLVDDDVSSSILEMVLFLKSKIDKSHGELIIIIITQRF